MPEISLGILAACLPFTPKFFQSLRNSKLWSGFNSSFHAIIQSKSDFRPSDAPSDKRKAAKTVNEPCSHKVPLRTYNVLPDEIELTTGTDKNETSTRDDHWVEGPQNLQIMRTVHIATTHEVDPGGSTMPDVENQASGLSYGYHRY